MLAALPLLSAARVCSALCVKYQLCATHVRIADSGRGEWSILSADHVAAAAVAVNDTNSAGDATPMADRTCRALCLSET